jgi:hypothetical protein
MTDERTPDRLAALDERGRAAAAGVRAAVAERPVPVLDPDALRIPVDGHPAGPNRGGRRLVPLLAAAAAVLVVLAAVAVLVRDTDDDSAPADRAPVAPEDLGRYVLSAPPPDLPLRALYDARAPEDPQADDRLDIGTVTLYGPDATTPVVGVRVLMTTGGSRVGGEPASMTTFDLDDRRAWRGEDQGPGDGLQVVLGDVLVEVLADDADDDVLLAVAEALEVEGARATVPLAALPDGWRHVGTLAEPTVDGFAALHEADAPPVAWAAVHYRDDGSGDHFAVTVAGGTVADRLPAVAAEVVDEVEVRGHDAVVARSSLPLLDLPEATTVTWEERPGEVVQIVSTALDGDELVALAGELDTVTPDGVEALRRDLFETALAEPGTTVVGRGTTSDGVPWAVVDDDGDEFLEMLSQPPPRRWWFVAMGTSGGSSEDAAANPLNGMAQHATGGGAWLGFGGIDPDVAAVEVRLAEAAAPIEATILEGGDQRAWAAEVPPPVGDAGWEGEVVAIAADGAEIGRLQLGQVG